MARWNDCEVEREMRSYQDDFEPLTEWEDYPDDYYNEFPKNNVEEIGRLMELSAQQSDQPPF